VYDCFMCGGLTFQFENGKMGFHGL
jgi:hypothetical protein